MIDRDDVLRAQLERLVPMPSRARASWNDALERAASPRLSPTPRRRFRRRLVLGLAFALTLGVALAASPLGAAIGRGVGDFSAWLTGQAGEPASPAEQLAFEAGERRSWGILIDSPQLRRLVQVREHEATFTLYGFRAGSTLCLRLVADGLAEPAVTSCAPLTRLDNSGRPAVVAVLDRPLGRRDLGPTDEGYASPRFAATFGIVAEGVDSIEVVTDRARRASVAGNAFLALTSDPPRGVRTRRMVALHSADRVEISLSRSPFVEVGSSGPPGVAPGPQAVQRDVEGGTIAWLRDAEAGGGRRIRPDPGEPYELLVTGGPQDLCVNLATGDGEESGGCGPLDGAFRPGPVHRRRERSLERRPARRRARRRNRRRGPARALPRDRRAARRAASRERQRRVRAQDEVPGPARCV